MAVKLEIAAAICLGLLALAAGQSPIDYQNGSKRIHTIHPTIHRATLRGPSESILETDSTVLVAEKVVPNEPVILKRESGLKASTGSSATSSLSIFHQVNYEYEIEYTKRHVNDYKIPVKNRDESSSCRSQVFRGFDVLKLNTPNPRGPLFMGVGLSDNSFCVFFYNETVAKGWKVGPLEDAERSSRANPYVNLIGLWGLPLYRVSAITVRELAEDTFSVQTFNEAGGVIEFQFRSNRASSGAVELLPRTISVALLTSVFLDNRLLPGVAPDPKLERLLTEAKDASESGKDDGKVVMERHFNHAFVEAIAMLEGSLIYSRCFLSTQRVNFINGREKWPSGLDTTNSGESRLMSVQAIEAYKHNGLYYYHLFNLEVGELEAYPDVYYWWCKAKTLKEAADLKWATDQQFCRNYTESFGVGLVPIDVVYRATCSKVYAFYQHMFQTEDATNYFTNESPFTVIDWMKFPVNAILHHKERLYFFEPANRLRISKPIKGCSFAAMSFEQGYFYQSDLLLMFKSDSKMLNYTQTVPIYDGERTYEEGTGWDPPLNQRKPIDRSCKLDRPGMSPSSSSGNMMLIVLILGILFAILCAIIYYFFFTNPSEQPPRRLVAKSSLRPPRDTLAAKSSAPAAKISAPAEPAGSASELDQQSIRSHLSKAGAPLKSAMRKSIKSRSPVALSSGLSAKRSSGLTAKRSKNSPAKRSNRSPPAKRSAGPPSIGSPAASPVESPAKPPMGSPAKPPMGSPGEPASRSPAKPSGGSPGPPAGGSLTKRPSGSPAKPVSGQVQ